MTDRNSRQSSLKPSPESSWERWATCLPNRCAAVMALALAAAGIAGYFGHSHLRVAEAPAQPVFRRITFRRGNVLHARFAPDGKSVVYGAAWGGNPTEVFLTSPGNPESRPLG